MPSKPAFVLTTRDFSSRDRLRKALPKDFDVNEVFRAEAWPHECRPLEWAAMWPNLGVVEYLLSIGGNANSTVPKYRETPLHCALAFALRSPDAAETRRRCAAARLLLAAGADPNANATTSLGNRARNTPFSYACGGRGRDVSKLLEEMLPLVDMSVQSPDTLLWSAINNEHEDIVARCLEAGVDIVGPHRYNGETTTVLRYAVSRAHDNARIVQLILNAAPTTPAARRAAAKLALAFQHKRIVELLHRSVTKGKA